MAISQNWQHRNPNSVQKIFDNLCSLKFWFKFSVLTKLIWIINKNNNIIWTISYFYYTSTLSYISLTESLSSSRVEIWIHINYNNYKSCLFLKLENSEIDESSRTNGRAEKAAGNQSKLIVLGFSEQTKTPLSEGSIARIK